MTKAFNQLLVPSVRRTATSTQLDKRIAESKDKNSQVA